MHGGILLRQQLFELGFVFLNIFLLQLVLVQAKYVWQFSFDKSFEDLCLVAIQDRTKAGDIQGQHLQRLASPFWHHLARCERTRQRRIFVPFRCVHPSQLLGILLALWGGSISNCLGLRLRRGLRPGPLCLLGRRGIILRRSVGLAVRGRQLLFGGRRRLFGPRALGHGLWRLRVLGLRRSRLRTRLARSHPQGSRSESAGTRRREPGPRTKREVPLHRLPSEARGHGVA
mmetsp:Transcript_69261/g.176073  ORF Transcript_69261/g.176073 Transcript_69261/m.176073 type:complete len:230 (+) Transcript_69261:1145-1834(+)